MARAELTLFAHVASRPDAEIDLARRRRHEDVTRTSSNDGEDEHSEGTHRRSAIRLPQHKRERTRPRVSAPSDSLLRNADLVFVEAVPEAGSRAPAQKV